MGWGVDGMDGMDGMRVKAAALHESPIFLNLNLVGPWLGPGSWPFVFDATSHREVMDGFAGREVGNSRTQRRQARFLPEDGEDGIGRAGHSGHSGACSSTRCGLERPGWVGSTSVKTTRRACYPVRPSHHHALFHTHHQQRRKASQASIDEQRGQKQRAAGLERNRLCMHKPAQASRALIIHTNRRAYYEAHTTAVFCELLNTRVTALPTA